jgi:hypothetical protein
MAVIRPGYKPGFNTYPKIYPGTARGRLLSAKIDTKPYRGTTIGDPNFGRPIGNTAQALNSGNERLGQRTVDTALQLLEARLDPMRKPLNAFNRGKRRGVRASLAEGDHVEVDPYGRGYQVGSAYEFFRYDAGYVTVTERGGGFTGDMYGKILAFDGRPTTATADSTEKVNVFKSAKKRDAEARRIQNAAVKKREAARRAGDRAGYNQQNKVIERQNKKRRDIYAETEEVKDQKRSGSFRVGRPLPRDQILQDGKAGISRLAAGFKPQPKGTKGGYTWQIRNERAPKNFFKDAGDLVWAEAQAEYRNAFRRFKITGFTKGSIKAGPVVSANPVSSPFYN